MARWRLVRVLSPKFMDNDPGRGYVARFEAVDAATGADLEIAMPAADYHDGIMDALRRSEPCVVPASWVVGEDAVDDRGPRFVTETAEFWAGCWAMLVLEGKGETATSALTKIEAALGGVHLSIELTAEELAAIDLARAVAPALRHRGEARR